MLGLVFHEGRLRHVLPPEAPLPDERTWQRLASVFARDDDGHIRFKRPALQEVAYENLPFRLRRELHTRIARALEPDLGRDVDADPAILSRHFELAGDNTRAWQYALRGAERASARFASTDAAQLYRRAIAAGRSNGATSAELADAWEALGQALFQIGEVAAASDAYTSARRLSAGDPIAEARLYYRHGQIAERGQLSAAVRWMRRGLRTLEGVRGPKARCWRARLVAELGYIRQRQRRYVEAVTYCREALEKGETTGELRAKARAAYILDLALFAMGKFDEMGYSSEAIDIYQQLDDPEYEGNVLNNLGAFAYWRGEWNEAVVLYRQAGICSERAGIAAHAADTYANIGEILSNQGRLEEAEGHLRRALRVGDSTGYRTAAQFATALLGRLAVHAGRAEEGISLLDATAATLRQMGESFYADHASALLAEGESLAGAAERAVALTHDLLASGNSNVLVLRRARGIALARIGDLDGALDELRLAEAAAREDRDDYELALILDALAVIGLAATDQRQERDAIVERLEIVQLPSIRDFAEARDRDPAFALT